MLALGRKNNESVTITASNGERIVVTLVQKQDGHIKLAFDAPKSVLILRTELEEKNEIRR